MHRTRESLAIAICALTVITTIQADETSPWLADSNNGVKLWNPAPAAGETVEWLGAAQEATGPGIAIWRVNGIETGQAAGDWKAGKLDGHGVWQHSSGARYEGQWKNGRKHGLGVYTWGDGKRFCGRYQDDKRQEGAFYRADGKPAGDHAPTPAAHGQAFEAESAAILARQAAGNARRQAVSPVAP